MDKSSLKKDTTNLFRTAFANLEVRPMRTHFVLLMELVAEFFMADLGFAAVQYR